MKSLTTYIQQKIKKMISKNVIKVFKIYVLYFISLIIFIYLLIKFAIISHFLNCFIIIIFSLQPPGHMLFYNIYKNQYGFYKLKQAENFLIYFNFIIIGLKIINELYINHTLILSMTNYYKLVRIN